MRKEIPAPVIAVLADTLFDIESHAGLDSLFLYADAPGEPPEGSKPVKTLAWLRRINKESEFPLKVLGMLIESYMELPDEVEEDDIQWGVNVTDKKQELKIELKSSLERCNLTYLTDWIISDGSSAPSRSL